MLQLRCRVTPGQFDNEYAVSASQSNGKVFSLFVPKELVWCDGEPSFDHPLDGLLSIEIWKQQNGSVVVQLPRPSLEAGRFVTVSGNQIQEGEPVENR